MKRIMIVGGGEWQVPIIKKAKKMGYYVINTNLYSNSIGFKYADIGEVVDVIDKEKNLEIAKKYNIDAIITDQSDIAVPTVAYVAYKIGKPGIGIKKAELFTNKFFMREFCKKNLFIYPEYAIITSIDEGIKKANEIGYPVVIKPINNQSSRGVIKVKDNIELKENYNNTFKYAANGEIIIEKFIGGIELTVEGYKFEDKHISLAVSKKSHLKSNEMIADRLVYTEKNLEIDYDKLKELNNKLVDKMGIEFGITHAEYKYFNGEFYLIEIAARGGGTKISSDIVPAVAGIDINELLIKSSFGEKILSQNIEVKNLKCAVLEFFNFEDGVIKEVKGLEDVKKMEEIIDIAINFKNGDEIRKPNNDRERHGYFILTADSEEKLNEISKKVKEKVKIIYKEIKKC